MNENVKIKLPSSHNVILSKKVYEDCYCNFDETKYVSFISMMDSGQYFPQIMQFICVMICICSGHTSFKDVFLCNLLSGLLHIFIWYCFKLYKLPFVSFIFSFTGSTVFRLLLHFIIIAIVSLFIIKDWKVILFCLIGGLVTQIIKSFLSAKLESVKYCDEVAIYVQNSINS